MSAAPLTMTTWTTMTTFSGTMVVNLWVWHPAADGDAILFFFIGLFDVLHQSVDQLQWVFTFPLWPSSVFSYFSEASVRLSKIFLKTLSLQICPGIPGGTRKTPLTKLVHVTWWQEKKLCSFQVELKPPMPAAGSLLVDFSSILALLSSVFLF